jgi:hypothetical protein
MMMKYFFSVKRSEEGFVLVTSMVILIALTLIGIAAIMTSTVEVKIAGNDRLHKETFYQADGDTEVGAVLTYDNALCLNSGGFTDGGGGQLDIGNLRVSTLNFAEPGKGIESLPDGTAILPDGTVVQQDDANRNAVYYADINNMGDDTLPHTNFRIAGRMKYTSGSGLQMVSGYEGLGYGAAAGGFHMRYLINAQRMGALNSESTITIEWRMSGHLINNADISDCKY